MRESIVSERIPYSKLRVMFDAAQALEKQGHKMVHMELGRPDFSTPQHIVEAAVAALRRGEHHYSPNAGIMPLREAISARYSKDLGLDYNPSSEILVTNGVSEGIFLAMNALLNPGDQILVPDPVWLTYYVDPQMAFAEPISYGLKAKNGYQPDIEELEALITPRTKMIAIVSPSNPTGSLLSRSSIEQICCLAEKHDLIILSDEIYEKVIYPPSKFFSPAMLPGLKERCIILNGFSKYYAMTGWRLGYVLAPWKFLSPMLRYHQYVMSSCATFAQFGAVAALLGTQEPSCAMVEEFHKRRNFIHSEIKKIGLQCDMPGGAFYLFPSIKNTGLEEEEFVQRLLHEAHVVAVPGSSFGHAGKGHIRLSYACSMDDLKVAADSIGTFVKSLR